MTGNTADAGGALARDTRATEVDAEMEWGSSKPCPANEAEYEVINDF